MPRADSRLGRLVRALAAAPQPATETIGMNSRLVSALAAYPSPTRTNDIPAADQPISRRHPHSRSWNRWVPAVSSATTILALIGVTWAAFDYDRSRAPRISLTASIDVGSISELVLGPKSIASTIAVRSFDGTVRLWDMTTGLATAPLTNIGTITRIAFSPDGRTLATDSTDNALRLWDVADPREPRLVGAPLSGHTSTITTLAFSPDGRLLASGGVDGTVRLWDVATGHAVAPIVSSTSDVTSLAFSPDGHILAVGSSTGPARLWDIAKRADSGSLASTSAATRVAFSPDGSILAIGGSDGNVLLWDVTGLDRPRRVGALLTGQGGPVSDVAFSPDGRVVAVGGENGMVRLWDVTNVTYPRQRTQLEAGSGTTTGAIIGHDAWAVAIGGVDGIVRLWRIEVA